MLQYIINMNRISFIGGTERNLSNKIEEVFDSLYLSSNTLLSKYKDISSGKVIDKYKSDHITAKLVEIFKAIDKTDLINMLNYLNNHSKPCVHIKFIFEKFDLTKHIDDSVSAYLSKHGIVNTGSLFDKINSIVAHENKIKPEMAELINAIHLSRFDVDANLRKYVNLEPNADIGQIFASISRLEILHKSMYPIIKKKFDKLSALASKIVLLS